MFRNQKGKGQRSKLRLKLNFNLTKVGSPSSRRDQTKRKQMVLPHVSQVSESAQLHSPQSKKIKISKLYQNLIKINSSGESQMAQSSSRKKFLINRTSKERLLKQSEVEGPKENHPDEAGKVSGKCTVHFELNGKKMKVFVECYKSALSFKDKFLLALSELLHLKHPKEVGILERIVGITVIPNNLQLDYFINLPEFRFEYLSGESIKVALLQQGARPAQRKVGIQDFSIIKCIGEGGFSKVFLVRSRLDGQFYAMKLVEKKFIEESRKQVIVENERNIMVQIKHQFVARLYYFFQSLDFLVFVMEYCPGGQLYSFVRKLKRMPQEMAKFYFTQILIAIEHLHEQGVIYRDIKPENILIDIDGHVKLTDFGLAKPNMKLGELSHSFCGSPEYMSPEMIKRSGHSFQVDFYCLGAMLFELVVGIPPFYSKNPKQIYKAALSDEIVFPDSVQLTREVKSIIKSLMHKKASQRLGSLCGVKEVFAHPWFSSIRKKQFMSKQVKPPNQLREYGQLNFEFKDLKQFDLQLKRTIQNQQKVEFKNVRKIVKNLYYDYFEDSKQPMRSPQLERGLQHSYKEVHKNRSDINLFNSKKVKTQRQSRLFQNYAD